MTCWAISARCAAPRLRRCGAGPGLSGLEGSYTLAGPARRLQEPDTLDDVFRRLHRQASQPADADHAAERESPDAAVGVSGRHDCDRPRVRVNAARHRRRDLPDRRERQRVGDRCPHGPSVLALPPSECSGPDGRRHLSRQSRVRGARQPVVHDDARRARHLARHEDGRRRLGFGAGGLQERLRRDARAARRERQGHRRIVGRRESDARFHSGVRREDREAALALLHDPESRREGQRDVAVAGRGDSRRRGGVGDRHVRSRLEPGLLRHRQPESRITTATSGRATTSTPARSSRSTPTQAS